MRNQPDQKPVLALEDFQAQCYATDGILSADLVMNVVAVRELEGKCKP
jgi:hypothetical protein